jgi:hypothetical protein
MFCQCRQIRRVEPFQPLQVEEIHHRCGLRAMLQPEYMADLVYRYPIPLGFADCLRGVERNPALEIEPVRQLRSCHNLSGLEKLARSIDNLNGATLSASSCQSKSRILAQESMARRNCSARNGFVVATRTPRSMCPCFSNSACRLQGGEFALQFAGISSFTALTQTSSQRGIGRILLFLFDWWTDLHYATLLILLRFKLNG